MSFLPLLLALPLFTTATTLPSLPRNEPKPYHSIPTIWLCGDSTMAPGGGHNGTEGWGQYLQYSFSPSVAFVNNSAYAGRSARSFTREERFNTIVEKIKEGDWVVIEFGHNDGGSPYPAASDNGRADCPGAGNQTCPTVYALATTELGGPDAGVYFVPHGQYAAQAMENLGPVIVDANYPMDHTHTAPYLADVVAKSFVLGLKCGTSGLGKMVGNATARIEGPVLGSLLYWTRSWEAVLPWEGWVAVEELEFESWEPGISSRGVHITLTVYHGYSFGDRTYAEIPISCLAFHQNDPSFESNFVFVVYKTKDEMEIKIHLHELILELFFVLGDFGILSNGLILLKHLGSLEPEHLSRRFPHRSRTVFSFGHGFNAIEVEVAGRGLDVDETHRLDAPKLSVLDLEGQVKGHPEIFDYFSTSKSLLRYPRHERKPSRRLLGGSLLLEAAHVGNVSLVQELLLHQTHLYTKTQNKTLGQGSTNHDEIQALNSLSWTKVMSLWDRTALFGTLIYAHRRVLHAVCMKCFQQLFSEMESLHLQHIRLLTPCEYQSSEEALFNAFVGEPSTPAHILEYARRWERVSRKSWRSLLDLQIISHPPPSIPDAMTSLMLAVNLEDIHLVDSLLQLGVDVNVETLHGTALSIASQHSSSCIAQLLLRKGTDLVNAHAALSRRAEFDGLEKALRLHRITKWALHQPLLEGTGIMSQMKQLHKEFSIEQTRIFETGFHAIRVLRLFARGRRPLAVNDAILFLAMVKSISAVNESQKDIFSDDMAQFFTDLSRWQMIFAEDQHKLAQFKEVYRIWNVELQDTGISAGF
ncbi:hypothetical protein G7Y89_g9982 [Cudoniella acicularis]|uniref:SGNH hydrolase-type esterase domain-containing protein n=1 Tax=Cudoniella acicularis TaxID=354080 RepID=A0A8H4W1D5_9HELO|nr:hypothetical protein G7Y89_g9982 [Cudoniella acicularis]